MAHHARRAELRPVHAARRRRDLREQLYRAFVTRASSGEHDNTPLMAQILRLRREQAALLGYASYAEVSLASEDGARRRRRRAPARGAARGVVGRARVRDLDELRALAREAGDAEADDLRTGTSPSGPSACASSATPTATKSCARTSRCPRVLDGLFALAERLFGVRVRAADGEAPVWHPDVRFFRVDDDGGTPLAAFYLDPYSRPAEKRGGAWMDDCVGRSAARRSVRLPVAYLVCNQTPPVGDKPSLHDVRRGARRCSTSSATACSTC